MEKRKMVTPTRTEIEQCARELWHRDRAKSDDPSFDINPEISELRESGYLSSSRSSLMHNLETKNAEWKGDNENLENSDALRFDLKEAMKSGVLVSGTTGTGKSDLGMYLTDQPMNHGITIIVFDSSQDWQKRSSIPLYETLTSSHIAKIPERSVIFDISRLSVEQRQRLIEGFSQKLYQDQAVNPSRKYFLVFEEGSSYFKEGFMRSKRFSNTSMLMSEGRNYDVRFMVITQFFASIDKTAMRYMKQRYFGYTDEKNDVDYVKAFLGDQASKLRELRAGQFIYYNAGKTTKMSIEPYECENTKTEIPQQPIPAQPKIEPHAHTQDIGTTIAKLLIVGIFVVLMLKSL
jgi:hypothetical protein